MGETHRRARLWVPVPQALGLWARLCVPVGQALTLPATVGATVGSPVDQTFSNRYLFKKCAPLVYPTSSVFDTIFSLLEQKSAPSQKGTPA